MNYFFQNQLKVPSSRSCMSFNKQGYSAIKCIIQTPCSIHAHAICYSAIEVHGTPATQRFSSCMYWMLKCKKEGPNKCKKEI